MLFLIHSDYKSNTSNYFSILHLVLCFFKILRTRIFFSKNPKKSLHFAAEFDKIDMLVCGLLYPGTAVGSNARMRRCSRMAKCEVCGKGVTFGIKVSHSHRRSNRTWKPNVKRVKAIVKGTPCHVYVCSRCLRSGKIERA